MRIIDKKRFVKTVIYRITATIVAQSVGWFLAHNITINTVVLITDVASTLWYYGYETIYEKVEKIWIKK